MSFILKHEMVGLAMTTVDLSRLVLPAGFTEVPWPGFERVANPPGGSADKGAGWQRVPRAR